MFSIVSFIERLSRYLASDNPDVHTNVDRTEFAGHLKTGLELVLLLLLRFFSLVFGCLPLFQIHRLYVLWLCCFCLWYADVSCFSDLNKDKIRYKVFLLQYVLFKDCNWEQ